MQFGGVEGGAPRERPFFYEKAIRFCLSPRLYCKSSAIQLYIPGTSWGDDLSDTAKYWALPTPVFGRGLGCGAG
jgi:hypothetical protein